MIDLIYPEQPAPIVKGGKLAKAEDMLPVVDENGYVVGQADRFFFHHTGSMALHPVVHLHLINRAGGIYLQKRSASKHLFPSRWDTAVGGHVSYGERILEALYRESSEELGLHDFNPYSLDAYVFESPREKELVNVFGAVGDFHPTPDLEEVEEGRYWSAAEIDTAYGKGVFTPNFESEYLRIKAALEALL